MVARRERHQMERGAAAFVLTEMVQFMAGGNRAMKHLVDCAMRDDDRGTATNLSISGSVPTAGPIPAAGNGINRKAAEDAPRQGVMHGSQGSHDRGSPAVIVAPVVGDGSISSVARTATSSTPRM